MVLNGSTKGLDNDYPAKASVPEYDIVIKAKKASQYPTGVTLSTTVLVYSDI